MQNDPAAQVVPAAPVLLPGAQPLPGAAVQGTAPPEPPPQKLPPGHAPHDEAFQLLGGQYAPAAHTHATAGAAFPAQ